MVVLGAVSMGYGYGMEDSDSMEKGLQDPESSMVTQQSDGKKGGILGNIFNYWWGPEEASNEEPVPQQIYSTKSFVPLYPPVIPEGGYRPYTQPKGELWFDPESQMWFYPPQSFGNIPDGETVIPMDDTDPDKTEMDDTELDETSEFLPNCTIQ